eukprot:1346953-Amphidinium_carterae.1
MQCCMERRWYTSRGQLRFEFACASSACGHRSSFGSTVLSYAAQKSLASASTAEFACGSSSTIAHGQSGACECKHTDYQLVWKPPPSHHMLKDK